ncbi:MAG: hypothetical protein WBD36_13805 [Bacteroidota bacterium]
MKLYLYSSECSTFVQARWVRAKYVVGGIFITVALLLAANHWQRFVGNASVRTTNTFVAENEILRGQLRVMAPRLNRLEVKTRLLNDRATRLQAMLHRHERDQKMDSRVTSVTNKIDPQFLIAAANSGPP